MTKPLITIHNTETDKIETREMNAKEFAEYNKDLIDAQTKQAQADEAAAAKQAVLDKLGLSAEEVAALLG